MAFTFGSGGGFGQQNNQQQQQSSTPAFGGFGSTNTGTTTFGSSAPAFGQQAQQPQQTSLFGSTGGFGSTQNTTTPAFGTSNTGSTGGLFGSQPAASGGFGGGSGFSFGQSSQPATGGGLFGNNASTGFGSGLAGNSANPNDPVNPNPNCPIPTNGSADAPAHPKDAQKILMWKDNRNGTQTGADGKQITITGEQLLFDSIVALPMYWHTSPEELRAQDYQQNRKTAPAAPTTTFGGFGTSSGTGAFGSSAPAATPAFGQTNTGGGLFGSAPATNTGGGLFGNAGSAFGKPATPFGQTNTGTTGGLFGQPAASTSTNTGFGQTANTGTSAFGGFGQANQNKPTFSFGATSTAAQPSTGLFGQQNTTSGGFGQPAQTQPAAPAFGGFGQSTNTGGGLFGNNAAKPAGGGLFGNTNTSTDNKPTFSFGQTNTATQPSTGLFGQQNNQQQAQPAQGGGLFGNLGGGSTFGQQNNTGNTGGLFGNNAAKPATSLFGNTSTTTPAPTLNFGGGASTNTGGGLFGGGGGTSLFGNNQQQQQQQQPQQQQTQQGGGLFGGGGGGTSLFGSTFGQNQNNQPASGFGLSQPAPSFGGFGQSQNQQNNLQQSVSQSYPQLNTSIDQNPYGNNPIFANVQPIQSSGPQAVSVDSGKKQPALAISYRGAPRSTPKISKLRGFATSTSSPALNSSRFGSPAVGSASPLAASAISRSATSSPSLALITNGGNAGYSLPPEAFVARPSVKKLVIDQKHRESSDFLSRRRNGTATPTQATSQTDNNGSERAKIAFIPQGEVTDRHIDPSPSKPNGNKGKSVAMSAQSSAQGGASTNGKKASPNADRPLTDEDYYTKPEISALKRMSDDDRAEVHDFVVGRLGYGEVCWLEAVDLTGLRSLDELMGAVVIIEDREVMVYPGEYEDDKPDVGQGLNVPAAVSLKNCWPLDKATRNPIKDPNNARVQQHVRKLRKKQETEFVDYEVETGTWTFKVQHFSRYGLDESDEDEEDDVAESRKGEAESSSSAAQKRSTKARADRIAKRTRTAESPMSDTTTDLDEAEEAPPQATLEDDDMEDVQSDGSPSASQSFSNISEEQDNLDNENLDGSDDESEGVRRRKRSVVVPTPRFAPRSRLRALESPGKAGQTPLRSSRQLSATPDSDVGLDAQQGQQRPFAQRLGLEPRKLAVMQASFFSKPRQDPEVQAGPKPTKKQYPERLAETAHFLAPAAISAPITAEEDVPEFVQAYKPLRKWKTSSLSDSLTQGKEAYVADAGLAMGRSFGISWGPQGQLISNGSLACLAVKDARVSPNVIRLASLDKDLAPQGENAAELLEIQLSHTDLAQQPEEDNLPYASTKQTLRFQHLAAAYDNEGNAQETTLWKLGKALFDEIDLRLSPAASTEARNKVESIRRTKAISAWLRDAVAPSVEADLRRIASASGEDEASERIFALLSGHQVSRACEVALESGNIRLATLLSQIGGDEEFKADVDQQLQTWREGRADAQISRAQRKIYELFSGNVDVSRGQRGHGAVDSSEDIDINEGLDWLRAFALRFWYQRSHGDCYTALASYDQAVNADRVARPLPPYALQADDQQADKLHDSEPIQDILYNLLKLSVDPSLSVEATLLPRMFTASPIDYRLPWHLAMILSRSMQIRGFQDAEIDSFSQTAEQLTADYASQLEGAGQWQWAAFVYLHLAKEESREKAVRDLLARHTSDLHSHSKQAKFVRTVLRIPEQYLAEAQRDIDGLEG